MKNNDIAGFPQFFIADSGAPPQAGKWRATITRAQGTGSVERAEIVQVLHLQIIFLGNQRQQDLKMTSPFLLVSAIKDTERFFRNPVDREKPLTEFR